MPIRSLLIIFVLTLSPCLEAGILSTSKAGLTFPFRFGKAKIIEGWRYVTSAKFIRDGIGIFSTFGSLYAANSAYNWLSLPWTKNEKSQVTQLERFNESINEHLNKFTKRGTKFNDYRIPDRLLQEVNTLPLHPDLRESLKNVMQLYNEQLLTCADNFPALYLHRKEYKPLAQDIQEKLENFDCDREVKERIEEALYQETISKALIDELERSPASQFKKDALVININRYNAAFSDHYPAVEEALKIHAQARQLAESVKWQLKTCIETPSLGRAIAASLIVAGGTLALCTALVKLRGTHEYIR